MAENSRFSAPVRILVQLLLTIGLIYILSNFLDQYFFLDGGLQAYIIIGSLLTLMNLLVRPIINLLMLPFKLFMGIIALVGANALFLYFAEKIADKMDPGLVVLRIDGGVAGWLLVAIILGIANWIFKHILR